LFFLLARLITSGFGATASFSGVLVVSAVLGIGLGRSLITSLVLVLVVGGGEDDGSVPQVVKRLAPSTVLVEAVEGATAGEVRLALAEQFPRLAPLAAGAHR